MQGQFDESITANGQGHLTARKNELASQSQQEAKCVMGAYLPFQMSSWIARTNPCFRFPIRWVFPEAKIKERKERQRKNKQVVMAFVKHMQFQTHRKIFNQHFDCILYWKRVSKAPLLAASCFQTLAASSTVWVLGACSFTTHIDAYYPIFDICPVCALRPL